MDTRIPPRIIKIMLESNPLKSIMLVGRLAVTVIVIIVLVIIVIVLVACGACTL